MPSPSDPRALRRFVKAAEQEGFAVEFIQRQDFARLAEFDALFIRETTSVHHHTYRFARRAAALGLVTIDDPASIFRCTNKVYVAELLQRHGVNGPRTLIVHRGNAGEVEKTLGLPVVLKRPDSSFSRGVVKVETSEELARNINEMLERSALIIAQEYLPTDFDYRVGIIDRKPLYVCKYFMARSHWQIIRRDGAGTKVSEGEGETLAVEDAPPAVVRCALKAARLIGDGLYGVDVKQANGKAYVIEINDNPSLDAGVEDGFLGPDLYRRIMQVFLQRVEQTKRAPGEPLLPMKP